MPFLEKISGGMLGARAQQAIGARNAAIYGDEGYQPSRSRTEAQHGAGERLCAAQGCSSTWLKPWKSRRRPIFEDQWGCSGRCLHTLVRSAVRREIGEGAASFDAPHRHRVPLGLVLLAQGWITHPQLQDALQAQRASGQGRIGDWLAQNCGLGEEHIARGLGVQWSCPVLAMDGFAPRSMALAMPKRFIVEFGLVPLRVAGASILYLAFENRMNAATALGVEEMSGLKVESGLLPATQFEQARAAVLAAEGVPVTIEQVGDADELAARMVTVIDQKQPIASRLVRVHSYYWMRIWLESGAIAGPGSLPPSSEDVEDYLFLIGSGGNR